MALLNRLILRSNIKRILWTTSNMNFYINNVKLTSQMDEDQWLFYKKNWDKNRPTSPWTVYKPQLTTTLSLLHRITGVAIYSSLYFAALGLFVLPHNFPYYIDQIHTLSIHPHVFTTAKFILALPIMYHILNGTRHLIWDFGKGFELPNVYRSGYAVILLTAITSALVALKL
ncbi:unnamed protein product [Gordionus sp. m RMFG-2023]|uniref:succinate dehydrogenase cytochrome b560 subunit, mitochondrial-like n=1 Tax=Gordionus sp. m RMFG-2023 TaxID=3053472 RepID=UPI0030E3C5BE